MNRKKIRKMKMKIIFSISVKNKFVLYLSKPKRTKKNGKEKQFFVNGNFF